MCSFEAVCRIHSLGEEAFARLPSLGLADFHEKFDSREKP
jgi:hypothetical protein